MKVTSLIKLSSIALVSLCVVGCVSTCDHTNHTKYNASELGFDLDCRDDVYIVFQEIAVEGDSTRITFEASADTLTGYTFDNLKVNGVKYDLHMEGMLDSELKEISVVLDIPICEVSKITGKFTIRNTIGTTDKEFKISVD